MTPHYAIVAYTPSHAFEFLYTIVKLIYVAKYKNVTAMKIGKIY